MSYGNYGGNDSYTVAGAYGGGGGGGGGFLSQGVGGTQGSPSSTSKDRKAGTVRPVTIKQILECETNHQFAERNSFKIDGVDILHITIVARVRSVTDQTLNITYVVDDGTGQCNVKQWIDPELGTDGSAQNLQGKYIRIIGQLHNFNNKLSISAHAIRLVEDYNEVQYHLLEAVAMHLRFTRGPPGGFAPQGGNVGYGGGVQDTVMGGTGDIKSELGGSASRLPPGLSPTAVQVYKLVYSQLQENSDGLHVQVIAQRINMPVTEVVKATDELMNNGVAYTTLDDSHINVMEC